MFETIGKGSHDPSTLKGTLVRGPGISPYLSRSNNERGMFNLFNLFCSIHSFQLLKAVTSTLFSPFASSCRLNTAGSNNCASHRGHSSQSRRFLPQQQAAQPRSPIPIRSIPNPQFIHFIFVLRIVLAGNKYFSLFRHLLGTPPDHSIIQYSYFPSSYFGLLYLEIK